MMDDRIKEALWAVFAQPGWDIVGSKLRDLIGEYTANALNGHRHGEDSYLLGKLHVLQEAVAFMENLRADADPRGA